MPLLPRIPAHTRGQPLWRHETIHSDSADSDMQCVNHLLLLRAHKKSSVKPWPVRGKSRAAASHHMLHILALFLFPSRQISTSVKIHQAVMGAAVSTTWVHTTVSASGGTNWSEAGNAKVSQSVTSRFNQKTGLCVVNDNVANRIEHHLLPFN